MLEEALRYPTNGENALERLVIGGVLVILSALVLPAFLVYGYLVRSLAAVAAGDEEPPTFDGWEELFVDGIKAFVIALVYALVPVLLAVAFLVPVGVGSSMGGDSAAGILAGVGALGFLASLVVAVAVTYVIMAALSNFAVEGRLGAAFDLGAVGGLATSEPYLLAVVLAIVVQVIVSAVIFAAVIFTFGLALIVLVPLGAFINFWVYLVTVYLFGDAYRQATGGTDGADAAADVSA
jgi:hypothetical protein